MMYRLNKVLFVFLLAMIGSFLSLCPALAELVTIDGKASDGFARLTFTWRSPVPFVARIAGKQLKVQFSRAVESSFEGLPGELAKYIGQPRLSSGGKTVIFPLKDRYGLNFNARGPVVTVDLMDLEPPTNGRAVSATKLKRFEKVKVRTGQHANYRRIVFDWNKKVLYKVVRQSNRISLIFGRVANINISSLQKWPTRILDGAKSLIRGKETVVILNLPSTSRVRHFGSGSKVVVDVFNPTGRSNAVETKQLSSESLKFGQIDTNQEAPTSKQLAPSPLKEHYANKRVSNEATTTTFTTAPNASHQISLNAAIHKSSQQSVSQMARPRAQTAVTTEVVTSGAELSSPLKAFPNVSSFNRKLPSIFFGFSRAKAQTPSNLSPAAKTATIRFDWTEPVGAAVFRRAGALWVVFDKAKGFGMEEIMDKAKGVIVSADQVSAQKGTFLRFSTPPGINPSIRRDGYAWIFDFKKQPIAPKTPVQGRAEPNSRIGPRIFLPVRQAGEPIPFHDASVGDNLVIVPVIPYSHGTAKRQTFPKFQILPTAQGIVIQPKIDDLRVRTLTKGVQVVATSRLALSPKDPKAAAESKIMTLGTIKRIISSDVWRLARRDGIKNFNMKRQKMMADIANANRFDKLGARLILAQHYFGQNFGYETLGVLKRIKDENPNFEADPKFHLLRGGSNFLIGRYAEAQKDLDHPSLNENDEGEFWRAINQAGSGKLAEAAPVLKATGKVIVAYPKRIKMPLGMLIVDSAIKAGDIKFATNYLQMISEEDPTSIELDQLAFLEGKLQQLAGDFNAAVEAWESVAEGEHRPSIAHAIMRRVDLLLASKRMKTKEAIEELERIRFTWRGGEFEFKLLRKLGRSYLDNLEYRKGLNTLRSAVSFFRGHPAAPEVTQEMVSTFVKIYFTHAGDNISALRAIALFDEFKELTPSGEQGDKMIQKLADRLAQVDLLGRAAKLLSNQVNFRLKGVEKARVGARLATVYLVNKQPALAEEAIVNSEEKVDIPPYLVVQRRQLLARSYIDQGRENKALNLLDDDKTRYADLLRAEVYWKSRKWAAASRVFRRLVTSFGGKPKEKLNERQALFVMNLAISLTLGGDERGSEKVRGDFGAAMSQTSLKDAFSLIASPDATGLVDSRTVANKVKTVSNFKNFLASYEKRLKEGNLSQIN